MTDSVKFILDEDEIPKSWYNIVSDLPEPPAPVIHPGTGQPVGPDDLAPLFTLLDQDGRKVALKQLRGQKVVVYFYPQDDTPG